MLSIGFIVSITGVLVAGLAGVLGVWMERDPNSKMALALGFSTLIVFASGVEMVQTVYASFGANETDAQMALLLERLNDLSANSPELQQFVAAEVAVAARANPDVVKKMEANVRAKGGDPSAVRQMATSGRRQAAGLSAEKGQPTPRKAKARSGDQQRRPAAAVAPNKRTMDPAALKGDSPRAAMRAGGDQAKAAAADAGNKAKDAAAGAARDAGDKAKAGATDAAKGAGDKAKGAANDAGNKAKNSGNKAADDAKKKGGDAAKGAKDKLGF